MPPKKSELCTSKITSESLILIVSSNFSFSLILCFIESFLNAVVIIKCHLNTISSEIMTVFHFEAQCT